jgi:hypothetical protein
VMLLPVMKILAKNLICSTLGSKYDLLPQIMVFNVDVFNSLYVSSSIQSSNTATTMFAMISLDAVQALVSLNDLNNLTRNIISLRRKIPPTHPLKSACFVDIALQVIEEDGQAGSHLDLRRYSSALAILKNRDRSGDSIHSSGAAGDIASKYVKPVLVAPRADTEETTTAVETFAPFVGDPGLLRSVLSPRERKLFVHKTAQVLFTTEFVILVEYTEVIVPLIYCASGRA